MVVGTTYLHISIIMCFTILLSIYNWNIDFIAENQNGNPISAGMQAYMDGTRLDVVKKNS